MLASPLIRCSTKPSKERPMATPRHPFGWIEIYVQDMARAQAFYETVLKLKLSPLPDPAGKITMMAFSMSPEDLPGASGALVKMDGAPSGGNGVLPYFSCADCAVEASRVAAAGGNVHQPKMSIGDYGFCAIVADTEGNTIGLHSMV
jgi:uncharacterized protein